MKTLLFLNGPEGIQTGIEDGFTYLKKTGQITGLKWFYYSDYAEKHNTASAIHIIKNIATEFRPQLIVFFHIGKLSNTKELLLSLKKISSKPIIAYDEGDMYGSWAKPISAEIITFVKYSDVVSIRGLGSFYKEIKKYNKNIIFTPHHADITRFDSPPYILEERKNLITFIGNRLKPRYLSSIRRLPGAKGREKFIKHIGNEFQDSFKLYGNGWTNFAGNQGPIDFQKQLDVYRESWITVSYEHYPQIPFYFSNRLPMALLKGSLYVCHYHKGYEKIFKGQNFIFFFNKNEEAVDIINFILSLSKEELLERSNCARKFALKYFTPQVVWTNFFNNILKSISKAKV